MAHTRLDPGLDTAPEPGLLTEPGLGTRPGLDKAPEPGLGL